MTAARTRRTREVEVGGVIACKIDGSIGEERFPLVFVGFLFMEETRSVLNGTGCSVGTALSQKAPKIATYI